MKHSYYLGFLLLFVAELAVADGFAYGWKDKEGRWHFSDQRPKQPAVIVDLSPRNAEVGNLGGSQASGASAPSPAVSAKSKSKPKAKLNSSDAVPVTTAEADEALAAECQTWRERLSLSAGPMTPTARRKMENDYDRKCILGQR